MENTINKNEPESLSILQSRYRQESKVVKALNLKASPENEYNAEIRAYVPRSRLIGFDGIVRASRTRNQEPNKRPKDSTYMKLSNIFMNMRRMGIEAKWNIEVPEDDTRSGYWCELPDTQKPRVTHWRALDIINSSIHTGITWTHDWEPVQDAVLFDCVNGAAETFMSMLSEQGIRSEVFSDHGDPSYSFLKEQTYYLKDEKKVRTIFKGNNFNDHKTLNVIFRGEGEDSLAMWTWVRYAMSAKKIEAPEIGSLVTDISPYLEM